MKSILNICIFVWVMVFGSTEAWTQALHFDMFTSTNSYSVNCPSTSTIDITFDITNSQALAGVHYNGTIELEIRLERMGEPPIVLNALPNLGPGGPVTFFFPVTYDNVGGPAPDGWDLYPVPFNNTFEVTVTMEYEVPCEIGCGQYNLVVQPLRFDFFDDTGAQNNSGVISAPMNPPAFANQASYPTFLMATVDITSGYAVDITGIQPATNCTGPCDGQLTAQGLPTNPNYLYTWSTGQSGPTAAGLCPGNYTVEMQLPGGCIASETTQLTGQGAPLFLGGDRTVCEGSCVQFPVHNPDPGCIYAWYINGVPHLINTTESRLCINTSMLPGGIRTHLIEVYSNCGGCLQYGSASLTVETVAGIGYDPCKQLLVDDACCNTGGGGNPKKTALAFAQTSAGITISPNPGAGRFVLDSGTSAGKSLLLSVKDIQGKTVANRSILPGQRDLVLDGIPSGMYFFVFTGKGISESIKVIIE